MRNFVVAALTIFISACTPPSEAPQTTSEAPTVEPPPDIPENPNGEDYADIMERGEGAWLRSAGPCPIVIDFLPGTDGTLVRRETREEDPASMRFTVEPNARRLEGQNEMRWAGANGEARFVWEGEYATLLDGTRRCEYSRFLVRGPRPATLP